MSSQRSNWRERLFVNPSRMELEIAAKLESSGIQYQTQVEVPVPTADFYFATEPRPTLVFIDGRPHLTTAQMIKDEELPNEKVETIGGSKAWVAWNTSRVEGSQFFYGRPFSSSHRLPSLSTATPNALSLSLVAGYI